MNNAVRRVLDVSRELKGIDFDEVLEELAADAEWIDDHDALRCLRAEVDMVVSARAFAEAASRWRQLTRTVTQ